MELRTKKEHYRNPKNGHQDFKAEIFHGFQSQSSSVNAKKQIARISLALMSTIQSNVARHKGARNVAHGQKK